MVQLEDTEEMWMAEIKKLFNKKLTESEKYYKAYRNIINTLRVNTVTVTSAVYPWKGAAKIGNEVILELIKCFIPYM